MLKTIFKKNNQEFLKRWPANPKIVFFAAPNTFSNEIIQRFSIDLGLPIISMTQVYSNVQKFAGTQNMSHPFFQKAKEMLDAEDTDQQIKDKLALKMLRITNTTRDGFILTDFPRIQQEAEMLEEYRGGMNAFVHLNLPEEIQVQVEESKY